MGKYVYLIKYDAIEYYEVVGVFKSKKKAKKALARTTGSCHIEKVKVNFLDPDHEFKESCGNTGVEAGPKLVLDAGLCHVNCNVTALEATTWDEALSNEKTWINSDGEVVTPKLLGETR